MKPYWIKLEPLSLRETETVESFLAGTDVSVAELVKRPEYYAFNLKPDRNLREIRKEWKQKILGPFSRTRDWKPGAVLRVDLITYTSGKQKMRVGWRTGIREDFFRWLLVRAVATGQIERFILCAYCGAARCAKTSRKGRWAFCSDAHRARFHYVQSWQGAKDWLKKVSAERDRGIPCSLHDILALREYGIPEGSRRARAILRRVSFAYSRS